MSKTANKRRFLVVLVVALLMLVTVIGCSKKEEAPVKTAEVVTTVKEPAKVEPVKEEAKVEVAKEAPVEEVVVPVEVEVVETVEEIIPEESASEFPLKLSTTVGGEDFSIEAYDGYAFVYYPESYPDEEVDNLVSGLVAAYPEVEDLVGWTLEDPGLLLIAYPFGLSAEEITSYVMAIESVIL